MSLFAFAFFLWPITLFQFGLKNLGYRFFRAIVALLVSFCGFVGYAIIPYRLLIFSHYYPLPMWAYIAIPAAYILGFVLYWKIDDSPFFSLM
jgi:hypothetical protein